jgi:hypothetical protein
MLQLPLLTFLLHHPNPRKSRNPQVKRATPLPIKRMHLLLPLIVDLLISLKP